MPVANLNNKLSIIVPVLNEATELPNLLEHLQGFQQKGCEIIIVDGGSIDSSKSICENNGVTVATSMAGRAQQLNTGADLAQGDILLFLHADTRLPQKAAQLIEVALSTKNKCWGRFDVSIDARGLLLRTVSSFINMRSRLTGIATGDQAIFMSSSAFDKIGGFPVQPLMEDIEISNRLLKISRPICLSAKVSTSARRWQTYGAWHTIFLMWKLRWAYWRGVSPQILARKYR